MLQQYDYYKILQVHNLAEPDIIEGAYKRLVKKYHPDSNPGSNTMEMMLMINEAYSVLKDPGKRKNYNKEWEKIHQRPEYNENKGSKQYWDSTVYRGIEKMFVSAKAVLDDYFSHIRGKDYAYCYDLISSPDKKNISEEEFIHWQEAVSKIYRLKEYSCEFYGIYRDKLLNGIMYPDVLEFNIKTDEYNTVMDMSQKDQCTKMAVPENGKWYVYIGYEQLQPIISKFNHLNGLLNAKSVMNELMEQHIKVDITTGLPNQRGMVESIEREISRHDRYGNVFSMILFELNLIKLTNLQEEKEILDDRSRRIGELLKINLRKMDIVGRWSEKALLIVLPETGLIPAIKVSHKIEKLLKEHNLAFTDPVYRIVMDFGIAEYTTTLEEAFDRMYGQLR